MLCSVVIDEDWIDGVLFGDLFCACFWTVFCLDYNPVRVCTTITYGMELVEENNILLGCVGITRGKHCLVFRNTHMFMSNNVTLIVIY